MPDLSVVMCVYNGAAYLRDSLDGVLQQSLWEFEFVIVDDGSDDQTPEILAAYAKSDPRIRILRQENAGVAAALARGCGAARGDLIARIDADDIPLPERFERQMAFMESRPDVGVLGTGVEVIDASGRVRTRKRPTRGHPAACWQLLFGPPVYHPTVMLRRALLEQAGSYDPGFDCGRGLRAVDPVGRSDALRQPARSPGALPPPRGSGLASQGGDHARGRIAGAAAIHTSAARARARDRRLRTSRTQRTEKPTGVAGRLATRRRLSHRALCGNAPARAVSTGGIRRHRGGHR